MGILFNELFHAWFDQELENNALSGAWLWNIINNQPGLSQHEAEEAMSELINQIINAMQTGQPIPKFGQIIASGDGTWWNSITPGHTEPGEVFGGQAGGTITEELYYATFWLLFEGYSNPLPHRRPGTPGACSPLVAGLDDGDILFYLQQFFNVHTRPARSGGPRGTDVLE